MTNLLVRILLLTFFTFFMTSFDAEAQSRQRLRELEKKEQQREKEQQTADEAAKKRHYDIQSRSTKKEMRRLKKQSKRHNTNRRAPFWTRFNRLKKKRR